MKNFYERFKTEGDFEVNGVWIDFDDVRIRIARAGNKNTEFNKVLRKVLKRYENVKLEDLSKKDSDAVMAEVYARTIIKSWEVKDESGNWISGIWMPNDDGGFIIEEFNTENVKQCLVDLPDLFSRLRDDSQEMSNFQREEEEKEAKN